MRTIVVVMSILAVPAVAAAQPGWQKYAVPETGANVDLPMTIFSEDAGQPESGYGRRFLTADGRANLTVQSVPNRAGDSPACKDEPACEYYIQEGDTTVLRRVQLSQRQDLVQPL